MTTPPTPAGWYPDPEDSGGLRYWDGVTWTEHRTPRKRRPCHAAPEPPRRPGHVALRAGREPPAPNARGAHRAPESPSPNPSSCRSPSSRRRRCRCASRAVRGRHHADAGRAAGGGAAGRHRAARPCRQPQADRVVRRRRRRTAAGARPGRRLRVRHSEGRDHRQLSSPPATETSQSTVTEDGDDDDGDHPGRSVAASSRRGAVDGPLEFTVTGVEQRHHRHRPDERVPHQGRAGRVHRRPPDGAEHQPGLRDRSSAPSRS